MVCFIGQTISLICCPEEKRKEMSDSETPLSHFEGRSELFSGLLQALPDFGVFGDRSSSAVSLHQAIRLLIMVQCRDAGMGGVGEGVCV